MSATVRAGTLSRYVETARQVGLNPHQQLKTAGIDPRVLKTPEARLPARVVARLLEDSAAAADCPTFGLRLALAWRLSDIGPTSLMLTHQPTLRAALSALARHRHRITDAAAAHFRPVGDVFIIPVQVFIDSPRQAFQFHEYAVGQLVKICRAALGARWFPDSANFGHRGPDDRGLYHRLFGPNVNFSAGFDGLACSKGDMDRVNANWDEVISQYAEQFAETIPSIVEETIAHEVRRAVYVLMPIDCASLSGVAKSLGLTERTLQRRLDDEGVDFSNLLNDIKRDSAARYLSRRDLALDRVAELVGYSSVSTFTRWFSSQHGVSPAAWRKSQPPGA